MIDEKADLKFHKEKKPQMNTMNPTMHQINYIEGTDQWNSLGASPCYALLQPPLTTKETSKHASRFKFFENINSLKSEYDEILFPSTLISSFNATLFTLCLSH